MEKLVEALRSRGVTRIRTVRFKRNRTRLLSVSRDGGTLHAHECFRAAPAPVLDAIASFLTARRGSRAVTRALHALRSWPVAREALARIRADNDGNGNGRGRGAPCAANPRQRRALGELYRSLNRARFGNRLPADVPIRLSPRMTRTFGHVRYGRGPAGQRAVLEVALNPALLRDGGRDELIETLLHEMAHMEAWLMHGHAGHGEIWRCIARRVGCQPRASVHAIDARRPAAAPRAGVSRRA